MCGRSDSLHRCPQRPSHEAVKVMLMLQEIPGYWRCQSYGIFAKESCQHRMELAQERGHMYNQQTWKSRASQGLWSSDEVIKSPRFWIGAEGFGVDLAEGSGLALSDLFLLSLCISPLILYTRNLEIVF